jgi:hypothetical protein
VGVRTRGGLHSSGKPRLWGWFPALFSVLLANLSISFYPVPFGR